MKERRKFIRLQDKLEIHYIFKGSKYSGQTKTLNISPEGVRFLVPQGTNQGESVNLIIILPTGLQVTACGNVVWQKEVLVDGKKYYDIGVKLTDLPEPDKTRFCEYVYELLYKSLSRLKKGEDTDA